MSKMMIYSYVLGMVGTNCYIVVNSETKEALIVDPADNGPRLNRDLKAKGVKLVGVLLTHGHFDHIMAVDDLRNEWHAPVYAYEAERDILTQTSLNLAGMIGSNYTTEADIYLRDHQKITLAGFEFEVLHTPGHTKGSCCYYVADEAILFSGDTLFCTSVGRTDFPTGSMSQIVRSIKEKLFVLPDHVQVLPGHEAVTTIEHEKACNPFVQG